MKHSRYVVALGMAGFLASAACGDKGGPTETTGGNCGNFGAFSGNATGTGAASLTGCSYYAVSDDGSGPVFGMVITNGTSLNTITHTVNIGRDGNRPTVGTYPVGTEDTQFVGAIFLSSGSGGNSRTFVLTGGTVTVTASSANDVRGTLNVTGMEVSTNSTMSVSGSFTATCSQGSSSGLTFTC